MYQD
ncbi:hypothetical protein D030_3790A, partial [Vibrio parahaemolyticus AQ3810]